MWRRLARMCTGDDLERECGESWAGEGWWMMPTPSLLAEPSRPIAIGIVEGVRGSIVAAWVVEVGC